MCFSKASCLWSSSASRIFWVFISVGWNIFFWQKSSYCWIYLFISTKQQQRNPTKKWLIIKSSHLNIAPSFVCYHLLQHCQSQRNWFKENKAMSDIHFVFGLSQISQVRMRYRTMSQVKSKHGLDQEKSLLMTYTQPTSRPLISFSLVSELLQ